jgi:hypothetical protein
MKASQTRIKNSIAEKGVTIDVGAGLPANGGGSVSDVLQVKASSQASQLTGWGVSGRLVYRRAKTKPLSA